MDLRIASGEIVILGRDGTALLTFWSRAVFYVVYGHLVNTSSLIFQACLVDASSVQVVLGLVTTTKLQLYPSSSPLSRCVGYSHQASRSALLGSKSTRPGRAGCADEQSDGGRYGQEKTIGNLDVSISMPEDENEPDDRGACGGDDERHDGLR